MATPAQGQHPGDSRVGAHARWERGVWIYAGAWFGTSLSISSWIKCKGPPGGRLSAGAGWQPGANADAKLLPAQPGAKQLHLPPASFLENEEDAEAEDPQSRSAVPPGCPQTGRAGGARGSPG